MTNAEVLEITQNAVKVKVANREEKRIEVDSVVLCERVSDQALMGFLVLNVDVLEVGGDAIAPRWIYTATSEGFRAGRRV